MPMYKCCSGCGCIPCPDDLPIDDPIRVAWDAAFDAAPDDSWIVMLRCASNPLQGFNASLQFDVPYTLRFDFGEATLDNPFPSVYWRTDEEFTVDPCMPGWQQTGPFPLRMGWNGDEGGQTFQSWSFGVIGACQEEFGGTGTDTGFFSTYCPHGDYALPTGNTNACPPPPGMMDPQFYKPKPRWTVTMDENTPYAKVDVCVKWKGRPRIEMEVCNVPLQPYFSHDAATPDVGSVHTMHNDVARCYTVTSVGRESWCEYMNLKWGMSGFVQIAWAPLGEYEDCADPECGDLVYYTLNPCGAGTPDQIIATTDLGLDGSVIKIQLPMDDKAYCYTAYLADPVDSPIHAPEFEVMSDCEDPDCSSGPEGDAFCVQLAYCADEMLTEYACVNEPPELGSVWTQSSVPYKVISVEPSALVEGDPGGPEVFFVCVSCWKQVKETMNDANWFYVGDACP